jgi:hypothetical protein
MRSRVKQFPRTEMKYDMEDSILALNLKDADCARKDSMKVNIWRNIFVRFR